MKVLLTTAVIGIVAYGGFNLSETNSVEIREDHVEIAKHLRPQNVTEPDRIKMIGYLSQVLARVDETIANPPYYN